MADYTFVSGQELKFHGKDTELYHYWSFGDGTPISNTPNPSHIYSSLGMYTISHWAQSPCGTCTALAHTIEIVSDLSQTSTAQYKFRLGEEIYLNRKDTDLNHYWNFGDGTPLSTTPSPTHIYSNPGTYYITHTAQNTCGTCVAIIKTVEILSVPPCPLTSKHAGDPVNFQLAPTGGTGPYTIEFRKNGILIDPSLLLDEFGIPSISNPLTNVPPGTSITRVYTLTDADIVSAIGGICQFSTHVIDSCPPLLGGPKSDEKICNITVVCSIPICDFDVT